MSNWCHTSITFKCTKEQFREICYALFDLEDGAFSLDCFVISNNKLNSSNIIQEYVDFGINENRLHYVSLLDTWKNNYPEINIKKGDTAIRSIFVTVENGIIISIQLEDEDGIKKELDDNIQYTFQIYYNTHDYFPNWYIPIAVSKLIDVDFEFTHSADTEEGSNTWLIKNHELYAYVPYDEEYVEDEDGDLIEINQKGLDPVLINNSWRYWADKRYICMVPFSYKENYIEDIKQLTNRMDVGQRKRLAEEINNRGLPLSIRCADSDQLYSIKCICMDILYDDQEYDDFEIGIGTPYDEK